MKTVSKILKVLTLLLSAAGLALFFTPFVTLTNAGETVKLVGAEMAFGAGEVARSPKIMFCVILSAVALIASAFTFSKKSKAGRWFNLAVSGVAGIYMLVVALSKPWVFFDLRPYTAATDIVSTSFVWIVAAVLLATFVSSAAYILAQDAADVAEAKSGLTIPKRIVKFFREYKSEVKKIVWPGPRSVVKNTVVVLILCALLGILIWLLDWGLSSLIGLIVK